MKLALRTYDYIHFKHKTFATNTSGTVEGSLALYPHTITKSSEAVIGDLKQVTVQRAYTVPLSSSDYVQIPQGEWIEFGFRNAEKTLSQFGEFSSSSPTTTASLVFSHAGESATSKYELYFQHPVGLQYYKSPEDITPNTTPISGSRVVGIGAGFRFELYMESKIRITNNSVSNEYIRIYDLYFEINNTVKSGIQTKAFYAHYGDRIIYNRRERRGVVTPQRLLVAPITYHEISWDGDNIYATGYGRMYERWIGTVSGSARSNGRSAGDIIHHSAGITESILRDEIFVERGLDITGTTNTTTFACSGLRSSEDDYYNNAIFFNATTGHKSYVTDYTGATKTIVIASGDSHPSFGTNNSCFLTNVQGDNKINIASFDLIGNTTNGLRKDWLFGRSIYQKQNARELLRSLCFESHSILNFSNQVYKLMALDDGAADATWTAVAYDSGREGITSALTPLENVYTSFRLKYHYDYGKGEFTKEWFVDGNGFTSGGAALGSTEQTLCTNAKENYKVANPFEYGCLFIYDDATAEKLLIKLVNWFTKQRWLTSWTQTFKDYCQYDIGDKIILNYADFIPNAINNSSKFMIFGKNIMETKGRSFINFNLMEL